MGELSMIVSGIEFKEEHLKISNENYDLFEFEEGGRGFSATVLKPNMSTRGHRHTHPEVYLFSVSGATLQIDNASIPVVGGLFKVIRGDQFHRVINDTNEPYTFACHWDLKDVGSKNY